MTHKCFKCERRFATSGAMVQHMKEDHSSFVEDAKQKIDRSQEISFEEKRSSENYVATAKCPFCTVDCVTRRKLMHHLSVEHEDEEEDSELEPELKIIRVENDTDDQLLGQLRKEQDDNNIISTEKKSSIVNDLLDVLSTDKEKKEVSIPGTDTTVKVSATSFKFPEKRYRCFWCDACFRKRGKLMDHIDMFHKDNKQQTEVEAKQIISSTYAPAATVDSPTPKSNQQTQPKKTVSPPSTSKSQPQKAVGRRRTNSSKKSCSKTSTNATEVEKPEMIDNKVCRFICLASITEVSRIKSVTKPRVEPTNRDTNCLFFCSKDPNPLPPLTVSESEVRTSETSMELPSPVQYSPYIGHFPAHSNDSAYCQQYQTIHQHAQNSDINCLPSPFQLPGSQLIYSSTFDSAVQFCHQKTAPAFSPTNQMDVCSQTLMDFEQQAHGESGLMKPCNYPILSSQLNPEVPLDLTLSKY